MSLKFVKTRPHIGISNIFKRRNECISWSADLRTGLITVVGRPAQPADSDFKPIAVFDIRDHRLKSVDKHWAASQLLNDKTEEILAQCDELAPRLT